MANIERNLKELSRRLAMAVLAGGHAYTGTPAAGEAGRGGKAHSGEAIVRDHFKNGNAARYGWPKLDPKYADWKRKRFGNLPQNVLTGNLRRSILGRGRPRVLQKGRILSIRWYSVPAYVRQLIKDGRNPVKPDAKDLRDIRRVISRHIIQNIRELNQKPRRPMPVA